MHLIFFIYFLNKDDFIIKWGLGIGDWGLGIGDWAQSPIPNPPSPIPIKLFFCEQNYIIIIKLLLFYISKK